MLRLSSRVVSALALAAVSVGPSVALPDAATPAGYVSFSQDVPCPPVVKRVRTRRKRVIHRVSAKRAVHRRVVRKVLARHVVRRHRPHLVRVSTPRAVRRCTVVRREPLTAASFGYAPEVALLQPVSYDIGPGGGVATITPTDGTGTPAIGQPPGGGTGSPGGTGGPMVAAAPEPSSWLLLIFGVAGAGLMLRRRRGEAQVGVVTGS